MPNWFAFSWAVVCSVKTSALSHDKSQTLQMNFSLELSITRSAKLLAVSTTLSSYGGFKSSLRYLVIWSFLLIAIVYEVRAHIESGHGETHHNQITRNSYIVQNMGNILTNATFSLKQILLWGNILILIWKSIQNPDITGRIYLFQLQTIHLAGLMFTGRIIE